jgi:elongation factor Ts
MAAVTTDLVKQLREMTSAGMMDARKALMESDGDLDKAVEYLQKKGQASATKKAGRIAAEGIVESYIHAGGKIGVLLEVNCESDFVARTEEFKALAHDICLHIAAMSPLYVSKEEISEEVRAHQMEIFVAQARETGKPENILPKIAEGRLSKWIAEVCLLDQPFVKDPDKTIDTLVKERAAKTGEKMTVRRFVRYQMGEGLQKRTYDIAKEVEEQLGAAQG